MPEVRRACASGVQGQGCSRGRRPAMATASVRLATPSFRRTASTWNLAIPSPRTTVAAISLFWSPRAIRASSSACHNVNGFARD